MGESDYRVYMPEIGSARLEGDMSAMQANLTVAVEDFRKDAAEMKTAVVEPRPETGLYVGYVPDLPGAHSQGGDARGTRRQSPGGRRDGPGGWTARRFVETLAVTAT